MSSKKYPEPKPDSARPSEVAESVATYTVSPAETKRKSSPKSRRIAGLEASDEVWAFAQKHQLVPHLETAIRLVKESFRDLRSIYLTFDPDPEIPSLDGIVIHAAAGGTLEDLIQQDRAFGLRFVREVPNEFRPKISLFFRKCLIHGRERVFAFAQKLAQMSTEPALRSAVSRAYYGAYHCCIQLLREFGFQFSKDASAHEKVAAYLNNAAIDEIQATADTLTHVRRRRNSADYDIASKEFQNHIDCQLELARAQSIILEIEKYSQEPLRTQLRDGLHVYHAKINP